MRIVVGLGNPGTQYAKTRHNAGFMVIDRLAERWGLQLAQQNQSLRMGEGRIEGIPALLVQPQRYMNLSGEALLDLDLEWQTGDLIVAHDDIDLPVGQLRDRQVN